MKERKEREKKIRRQQIRDAAKEVFLAKGLRSTTIEDIANRAELSPGTIYQYFKNKDEIYASINLMVLQIWFDETKKIYKNNLLSVEEKMDGFKEAMYKTFRYDPLLLRNVLHVQLEDTWLFLTKKLLNHLNSTAREILSMIADVYEEGVRQGKFIEGHGMAQADIMWGMFSGILLWVDAKRRLDPKKDFLKATLDSAFSVYAKGIIKNNPEDY